MKKTLICHKCGRPGHEARRGSYELDQATLNRLEHRAFEERLRDDSSYADYAKAKESCPKQLDEITREARCEAGLRLTDDPGPCNRCGEAGHVEANCPKNPSHNPAHTLVPFE